MRQRTMAGLLALALGVTACAYYDDYGASRAFGDYRYAGSAYGLRGDDILDPWLALTPEGRDIVRLGFARESDGPLDVETAERANTWFRRYADTDRDLRLTDEEIRVALVQGSRARGGGY